MQKTSALDDFPGWRISASLIDPLPGKPSGNGLA